MTRPRRPMAVLLVAGVDLMRAWREAREGAPLLASEKVRAWRR